MVETQDNFGKIFLFVLLYILRHIKFMEKSPVCVGMRGDTSGVAEMK